MTTPSSGRVKGTGSDLRSLFIADLYQLHADLKGDDTVRRARARRELARLRETLTASGPDLDSCRLVFRHAPPPSDEWDERKAWMVLAGIFAHHPQGPVARDYRTSLGGAMAELAGRQSGQGARSRFEHLLRVDLPAVPYYLRQAVQLLDRGAVPLDFGRLLDDVVVLLADDPNGLWADDRYRILLDWGADYTLVELEHANRDKSDGRSDDDGDEE